MQLTCSRQVRARVTGNLVTIKTPNYRAVINRTGARLESLVTAPGGFEWCVRRGLAEEVDGGFPGQLSQARFEGNAAGRESEIALALTCHGRPDAVIDWGMTVRKTFTFYATRPGIRVDLRLENVGAPKTLSSFRLHNEVQPHASSQFFTRAHRGFSVVPFGQGHQYARHFTSGLAGVFHPAENRALLFVADGDAVKEFYFYMSPELCTVEWFLKRIVIPGGHAWRTSYWIVPAEMTALREADRVLRANGVAERGVETQVAPLPGSEAAGSTAVAMNEFSSAAAMLVAQRAVGEKGVIERNIQDAAGRWFSQALSTPLGAGFELRLPDRPSLTVQARVTLRAGQHRETQAYLAGCDLEGRPSAVSAPARLGAWTPSQTLTLDASRLRGKTVRLALVGPEVLWTDVRVLSDTSDTVLFDSLSARTSDTAELAGAAQTSRRLTVWVRPISGKPTLECCCRDADGRRIKTSVRRTPSPETPDGVAFEIPVGRAASVEYTARCGERSVTGRATIPPSAWDALDARALRLYVSPQGRDTWSGRRAEPNRAKSDGPFATLAAASDCIRNMKQRGLARAITVVVRAGIHILDRTLILTPENSGTAGCRVTYMAEPGAKVVLSGGRRLTGPRQVRPDGTWVYDLPVMAKPAAPFRSLRINGTPAARTRWPRTGELRLEPRGNDRRGRPVFHLPDGNLADAPPLEGAELMARYTWHGEMFHVACVDPIENLLTLSRPLPKDRVIKHCHCENVPEAALLPGQWYVADRARQLVYRPRKGEVPAKTEIIAPHLRELIRFQGNTAKKRAVRHIAFEGFTFCDALRPEQQEGIQAACQVGGAVVMAGAEHCVLRANRFRAMEGYAVDIRAGCRDNLILNNDIEGMGAGGIRIGTTNPAAPPTAANVAARNAIRRCGRLYPGAVGIWVGQSGFNILTQNQIHHLPYTGISVGWTWGRGENPSQGNRIDGNHVHHVMMELHDGGAIYTLGWSYGAAILRNRIHDVPNGNGIYLDEGSAGILVRANRVDRPQAGLFLHGARANCFEGNIFNAAAEAQIIMADCGNHMADNRLCRNVFARGRKAGVFLTAYGWNSGFLSLSDFNRISGWPRRVLCFNGVDQAVNLAQWQRLGYDRHSHLK